MIFLQNTYVQTVFTISPLLFTSRISMYIAHKVLYHNHECKSGLVGLVIYYTLIYIYDRPPHVLFINSKASTQGTTVVGLQLG